MTEPLDCPICRSGRTRGRATRVTMRRNGVTVVVDGVPAQVCPCCGQKYLDETDVPRLLELVGDGARTGRALEMRRF